MSSRRQIERAANAIKFLVPLDGSVETQARALKTWTPKGLNEMRWPRDYGPEERRLIRLIAKTVLEEAS